MNKITINGGRITLDDIISVSRNGAAVEIGAEAAAKITACADYVARLVEDDRVVYGITTGFGEFSKVRISREDTADLQRNLIISHACGIGDNLPVDAARAMLFLRINSLAKGVSGIRLATLQVLADMLNRGVTPAIPEKGSLGASGDLVPLAHMVLPAIGLGEAYFENELMQGGQAMKRAGITPVSLTSKEGLALINGTQAMTAIGALALYDGLNFAKLCDIAAGLTMEALEGITDAFAPELHQLRPHPGQIAAAKNILKIVSGSECTRRQSPEHVQDAYSLRCIPQIHGASKDALDFVAQKIDIEINSVTDNPIIFMDDDNAISGGMFHGQPVALAFDFLAIALAELANVSERRVERLVNPALSRLPGFLTAHGGLHSGFMIAQYAAAALVSENKVLCHPASVDSIPSSANQEDHVSMGTIAARKARDVLFNASRVVMIELICAAQGIDLNERTKGKNLGAGTAAAYSLVRKVCDKLGDDRELYVDFNKVAALIDGNDIVDAVENVIGRL